MEKILIIPGLHNSGPGHWQTWFESVLSGTVRVEQADWERPSLADWAARVGEEIDLVAGPLWVVAHSFGCLAAVSAGFARPQHIRGALLVAPADPDRFGERVALLEQRLAFPSLVVASSDDPWVQSSVAEHWASSWGSAYLNVGNAGHINVDSGYGPWPAGLGYFEQLREGVRDQQV